MRRQFNHRLLPGRSRPKLKPVVTKNDKPISVTQPPNHRYQAEKKIAKQPAALTSLKNSSLLAKLSFFNKSQKLDNGAEIQNRRKAYSFKESRELCAEPVIFESNIGVSLLAVVALILIITTLIMLSKSKKSDHPDKTEEAYDEASIIDTSFKLPIAKIDLTDLRVNSVPAESNNIGRALLGAAILAFVIAVLKSLSKSKNNPEITKEKLDEIIKKGIKKMLKVMEHYKIEAEDFDTAISESLSTIRTEDVYEGSETYNAVNLLQHALRISYESGDLNRNNLIERVRDNIWTAYQSHTAVFTESRFLQLNRAITFIHDYPLSSLMNNLNNKDDRPNGVFQQQADARVEAIEYQVPKFSRINWDLYRSDHAFTTALMGRERINFDSQINSDNFLKEVNEILRSLNKPSPTPVRLLENIQGEDQENQLRPK